MVLEANTAMACVCHIERVCAPQVELSRRLPTWPVLSAQLLQVHSLSHSGREDGHLKWAPESCGSGLGPSFSPFCLLPQGFLGDISKGTFLTPSFVIQWPVRTPKLSPASIEGLCVGGTVPGGLSLVREQIL